MVTKFSEGTLPEFGVVFFKLDFFAVRFEHLRFHGIIAKHL